MDGTLLIIHWSNGQCGSRLLRMTLVSKRILIKTVLLAAHMSNRRFRNKSLRITHRSNWQLSKLSNRPLLMTLRSNWNLITTGLLKARRSNWHIGNKQLLITRMSNWTFIMRRLAKGELIRC